MELKHVKLKNGTSCSYREFNSISEFEQYIADTPLNSVFRWEKLGSSDTSTPSWYATKSYEEAMEKLHNGDKKLAEKLTGVLHIEKHAMNELVQKPSYSVAGYQASVPRYLQGLPTNMINKKMVVQKQRVITITKNIGYLGNYSASQIIDEAVRAVQLINTIEAKGIRCNLYVSSIAEAGIGSNRKAVGFRVKIKSAGERTHISKLAFPLANPSMLRRFSFRYREVAPETTPAFKGGYGASCQTGELFIKQKGEYYIPTMTTQYEMDNLIKSIIS